MVFKKVERNQYLRNLQKADNGYFKPFLIYIAGLLSQSLDAYLQGIEGKKQKLLTLSELAKETLYSASYLRVLALVLPSIQYFQSRHVSAISEGITKEVQKTNTIFR